jgi:beta-galactosidase GanA
VLTVGAAGEGKAVAGVARGLGKGKAYLLGTVWPLAVFAERCADTQGAVAHLLRTAGASLQRQGDVVRHRRALGSRELWALFNTADGPRTWPAPAAAEDLLTGERFAGGAAVTLEPWDVRVLVAGA